MVEKKIDLLFRSVDPLKGYTQNTVVAEERFLNATGWRETMKQHLAVFSEIHFEMSSLLIQAPAFTCRYLWTVFVTLVM